MSINVRQYCHSKDYELIKQFLSDIHIPCARTSNWLQQRWEYMHYHPNLNTHEVHRIGIWEDDGAIVGVANYEDKPGTAYIQLNPGYARLKADMVCYAEQNLAGQTEDGDKYLSIEVNEADSELICIMQRRGYEKNEGRPEWESIYRIEEPFPTIEVPEGFEVLSLADEYDLDKVNRVMWRGFNHAGEPPEEGLQWRRQKLAAPGVDKQLTIVVRAPNGDFAAFAGLWYDRTHKYAFVEPVATDPDYRRLGLGKAAVLEGIRRCKERGATMAYVGSGQKFYEAIGFRKSSLSYFWKKQF